MPSASEWKVPASVQPKPEDYAYDLDAALSAVVGVRAIIPGDAFTAETLGTERAGNGVLIRADGLVLTIGYLVTEAETIWLTLIDGRAVPGTVLAYDQATGFGLIQALARLDLPALPIGQSSAVSVGERVVVGGAGGRQKSVAARIVAKQEFAGYWEYVVDEAIFTAPSHPNWGGTALIGPRGELIGIGSLQLQEGREQGPPGDINMIVPIDLLKPIFDDLLTLGRPNSAAAALARALRHRDREPRRGGRARQGRAGAEGRSAHRRRAAFDRRRRGPRSRRALSQGLVARRGRARNPDVDLSRRQDHRDAASNPATAPGSSRRRSCIDAAPIQFIDAVARKNFIAAHRWIAPRGHDGRVPLVLGRRCQLPGIFHVTTNIEAGPARRAISIPACLDAACRGACCSAPSAASACGRSWSRCRRCRPISASRAARRRCRSR